jgi:hypothetical protein
VSDRRLDKVTKRSGSDSIKQSFFCPPSVTNPSTSPRYKINCLHDSLLSCLAASFISLRQEPKQPRLISNSLLEFKDIRLHDQKIGVRCAVPQSRVIGSIIFNEAIDSELDCEMILCPLNGRPKVSPACSESDCAAEHTVRVPVTKCVREQIVSENICPPRSPDLTPPDPYLCGAMNVAIFRDNPHCLLQLKEASQFSSGMSI